MASKSSSPAGIFRRLQGPPPAARELLTLGMYSPHLPEDVRVSLIQKGTAQLAGPEAAQEVRRESLETAAQAAGLAAALGALPVLSSKALTLGLDKSVSKSLLRTADQSFDALTLPGGAAHKDTALIGGDALSPRQSRDILRRLEERGVSYQPRSTVNFLAASDKSNLIGLEAREVLGEGRPPGSGAVDRLRKMFVGATPSAEELGNARASWSGSSLQYLNKELPGWDRPGTLDKTDFRRIAKALESAQGGDTQGARRRLLRIVEPELLAAAATKSPAGLAADNALGKAKGGARSLGAERTLSLIRQAEGNLKRGAGWLTGAPAPIRALATKSPVAATLLSLPVTAPLVSRAALGSLGVGAVAALAAATKRKKELERLLDIPPEEEDVRREIRARDKSTALSLAEQFGAPGKLETATLGARGFRLDPEFAEKALDTALLLGVS